MNDPLRKPIKTAIAHLFTIMFCWVLIGCNSSLFTHSEPLSDDLKDISILTDQPCKAPCWYNLMPDVSSKQEALDTLTTLSFIDASRIFVLDTYAAGPTPQDFIPAIEIRGICVKPANQVCVEILIVDNKVKNPWIFPNYKLTFDEVVNHLGKPDYVNVHPWGVECPGCVISLSWLQLSVTIDTVDTRCSKGLQLCNAIEDDSKVPHGLLVGMIFYSGSVPPYQQIPRPDHDFQWPGFEDP